MKCYLIERCMITIIEIRYSDSDFGNVKRCVYCDISASVFSVTKKAKRNNELCRIVIGNIAPINSYFINQDNCVIYVYRYIYRIRHVKVHTANICRVQEPFVLQTTSSARNWQARRPRARPTPLAPLNVGGSIEGSRDLSKSRQSTSSLPAAFAIPPSTLKGGSGISRPRDRLTPPPPPSAIAGQAHGLDHAKFSLHYTHSPYALSRGGPCISMH